MGKLTKDERHQRILAELTADSAKRLTELARDMEVSRETVRRDLDELSRNGIIHRTYGGAVVRPRGLEANLKARDTTFVAERKAIAKAAFELIAPGEVVMLSTGSTTLYLARYLASARKSLTVITNGLDAALILSVNPLVRVIVAPGDYDSREARLWGEETASFLRKFQADTAVIGASGLYAGGACEADSPTAWVDRVMLERAQRKILLMIHTKFDQPKLELICPLRELDVIISDRSPRGALLEAIQEAGVALKVVSNALRDDAA
jgi:DeoR/GlpR family transcriptional regulator of sugar metabolism